MPLCFGSDNAADRPLVQNEDAEGYVSESAPSSQAGKSLERVPTTDDELESRLSRRSSVLVDLLSLFRRSSSVLIRHNTMSNRFMSGTEDEEDDDDDPGTMNKERILEAIQHKREIIGKLRSQPWNMKRKRRTLKVAQRHLQRQEAKVSKVQLYKVEAGRRLTQFSRWLDNIKIYLIPWEAKIKRIESHFGSVVSSYFTFLRWTLGVNVTMTLIMLMFVIIPEWLADSRMVEGSERYNRTAHMKVMPEEVEKRADELSTVWDFGGYMKYSLIFYGYYARETFFGETVRYRVPVAYFLANLFVLGYSFFSILRKVAMNARNSKLTSGKTEQYVFNWKSFTGWDYTIGNAETSSNVYMANVIKFREAISEYTDKLKKKFVPIQIFLRVLSNCIIFCMFIFSWWAIISVSQIENADTFLKQNAVSITVSFITLIFPNIFELIGKMESLHPRTALRTQLFRVLILYTVNYYTLIISLLHKLDTLETERSAMEESYRLGLEHDKLHHMAKGGKLSRTLRQVLGLALLNATGITPNATAIAPATTVPPPTPWTTVFADFGPFAVSNPKAVVSKDVLPHNATIVVTQAIGPNLDWNRSAEVNYTSPIKTYTQPFRFSMYPDMCWETVIGQEITKLVTMDLLMTIAAILVIDFLRGLACRFCNLWWFWNLEKTFPEYGEFKVAENVLHLTNNQGMIWLGLFFVPMLPLFNTIKLVILMYIRSWAVMTCNVPARQIFRASRSSNFYLYILLLMLVLCTLPVGYVIASRRPSKNCGPFSNQPHFYSVISDVMMENLPKNIVDAIKSMMSPGIVLPVVIFLLLVIYFMFKLIRGLKDVNTDLTSQLLKERTEEKKKIFELAGGKKKKEEKMKFKNGKRKDSAPAPKVKPKFAGGLSSSDDDSQTNPKSVASARSRMFVPSLGSVSEVDHSDGDEQEHEESPVPKKKLTLKQRFLVCIGLSDPKQYEAIGSDDAEAGSTRRSEEGDFEENDGKDAEKHYLLPPTGARKSPSNKSGHERSRSPNVSNMSSMRDYRTPTGSRGSAEKVQAMEMTDRQSLNSYKNRSQPLENEFIVPQNRRTPVSPSLMRKTLSAVPFKEEDSESAASRTASLPAENDLPNQNQEIERTARKLLQPISSYHSMRFGQAPIYETASMDPTRPPSTDGSLSDPSPLPDSTWYNTNPHSSYTSAMMSPIMNEMLSTDEGTDDEKARLIPDRPPAPPETPRSMRTAEASPSSSRAPRFRISTSPPRRPMNMSRQDSDSSARRFEMRVAPIREEETSRPQSADSADSPSNRSNRSNRSDPSRAREVPSRSQQQTTV